jgi:hypothetical protein
MQNDGDDEEIMDAGASSDLPDESSFLEFLEQIQAKLAREGWELRGACTGASLDDALDDPANEILFIREPGVENEFFYFNRLEGWESVDGIRGNPNFLQLAEDELARDSFEYQEAYDEASCLEPLHGIWNLVLLIRLPRKKDKFYCFYREDQDL